ncbi:protein-glutamate methylesterase/protein-glutamine glutaminase [Gilvimarinus algae]|uniref:Protein-glutamate methylesterase/protein-glutamine glutaminase n=1 Tax=Gilvimarinus algae TaxID=3058037 RepID=A0ABT8THC5_9GAMM|nr:chemotaxis response regulator protein-glutamate methylesterase [Gilvimarinus sp. SDUM040014]MDO3382778.1 chemotaxis response regulator protein-glutamate methylesterase [Gilvimarinus sp. SDUM040014]
MSISVLVVDDSALIRTLLSEIVTGAPDMRLVGAAPDAYVARDLINQHSPDVVTLDIEMPRMDGLTFLDKMMRARPTPTIMISTLTEEGAEATLRALELGAVDFVPKPKLGIREGMAEYSALILEKIRVAAKARVRKPPAAGQRPTAGSLQISGTEQLLAIGASTGGTEAIKELLMQLPINTPGTVITQHMPAGFTSSYAQRLDRLCAMRVQEARGGERILPGHAYLAPGNWHLLVERHGSDYVTRLSDAEPVQRHRPSVDVMFQSVARAVGANASAVILTGMGKDGAEGMLSIRTVGGHTLAQDEQSCVVFGMPKEAIGRGGVQTVAPLSELGGHLLDHFQRRGRDNRV